MDTQYMEYFKAVQSTMRMNTLLRHTAISLQDLEIVRELSIKVYPLNPKLKEFIKIFECYQELVTIYSILPTGTSIFLQK